MCIERRNVGAKLSFIKKLFFFYSSYNARLKIQNKRLLLQHLFAIFDHLFQRGEF